MRAVEDVLHSIAPGLMDYARVSSSNIMVCCPFHEETGPSCSISRESPVFHCFGCGEGGHLSKLLKHLGMPGTSVDLALEGMGFGKAQHAERVRELKERKEKGRIGAYVAKTGLDPYRPEFVLDEAILDSFRFMPVSLHEAGFKKKTLRYFEVGFDRVNSRITFPLRSRYGDLVGISGRDLWGVSDSKYKVYTKKMLETTGFAIPDEYTMDSVKQTILWHGHIVLPLMTSSHTIVLAEGFKAVMWIYQAGYKPVVGLAGSALTDHHTELLCRYVNRVILFLDNNKAGHIGTHYAARRLEEKGITVTVANYPDDRQQPDDLTKEELREAISSRLTYSTWKEQAHVVHDPQSQRFSSLLSSATGRGQRSRW